MYFQKLFFQLLLLNSKISSLDVFLNNPEIAAAPATQQADDEPSPTPNGISDSTLISNSNLLISLSFCLPNNKMALMEN